jgi:hypothetical protein
VSVVFACSGTFREEVTTVEQSAANERRRVEYSEPWTFFFSALQRNPSLFSRLSFRGKQGSPQHGRVSVVFACSGTFREEVTTVEQSAANERRRVNGKHTGLSDDSASDEDEPGVQQVNQQHAW